MTDVTPEGLDELGRCIDDAEKWLDESAPGHTKACAEITLARATLAAMRAMLAERMPNKLQTCDIEACIANCTEGPASPFVPVAEAQLAALLAENARLRGQRDLLAKVARAVRDKWLKSEDETESDELLKLMESAGMMVGDYPNYDLSYLARAALAEPPG